MNSISSTKLTGEHVDYSKPIGRRIIGVEVTLETINGREELFMLTPHGGFYDLPNLDNLGQKRFIVTFHTSHGDIQGRITWDW